VKAYILEKQQPLENRPLQCRDIPIPEPGPGDIRIKVNICGACRTDLHIIEGELPAHKLPLIPGHQIVGTVDKTGTGVSSWKIGERVGVPWLYKTCGKCKFCLNEQENLCDNAQFTGYDADGGFAEFTIAPQDFVYRLPDNYTDIEAAPLLCAGVIGYQAFQKTGLKKPGRLGLFGFGSSAHIILQVALHLGHEVYVVSRTRAELDLASQLGAKWVGRIDDDMACLLDAGIVFAPSGELLVNALKTIDKGGIIVSAGIYTTPLPGFDYSLIWPEKCLCSIANTSRHSVRSFLRIASEFKIKARINKYPLADINEALLKIKNSKISGSTILTIRS
jgi:propanol-preferring alcohol dehydrogenase